MKAFLSSLAAMVVIAIGAAYALDALSLSSENVYRTDSVRLGD